MEENNIIKERVISKISLSKFMKESRGIKKNNYKYIKYGMVACVCLIFSTGIVFAKDIENYIKEIFNNSTKSIDVAVENGYVQNIDDDFTFNNDIGIKVDNLILDNFNLDISFYFKTQEKNIKSISFNDFIITTDTNKTIYSSKTKYVKDENDVALAKITTNTKKPIKVTDTDLKFSLLFSLRDSENLFNELFFKINELNIIYENNSIKTVKGNWNFSIKINNEMKQSSKMQYTMKNDNNFVEYCIADMSMTGTIIKLKLKESILNQIMQSENAEEFFVIKYNNNIYKPTLIEMPTDNDFILTYDSIGKSIIGNMEEINLYISYYDENITLDKM